MDGKSRCVYKRSADDEFINNYNPYILAVFQTSMDLQYNDGPQAVRYLAKYMAMDDYEAKIMLKSIRKSNSGNYMRTSYVPDDQHYATRIVGAVEATYDVMSWHKHGNSRSVTFINTNLAHQDSRRVKSNIKDLSEDDEDIYARSHVGKIF